MLLLIYKLYIIGGINMGKRNGIISFWKFLFCIMIVIFHGNILAGDGEIAILLGGYIGVEFFFIVSGFFLAAYISEKNKNNDDTNIALETLKFIFKKFTSFFPYILISFILTIPLYIKIYDYSVHQLISSIWGLFLLQESGFRFLSFNTPLWYLSSMLLSMFIIYPLMRKYKNKYSFILAPLIVYLGLGYLNHLFVGLNQTDKWAIFTLHNNIRAFSELNLGILLFFLSQKIKDIKFTKFGKTILTLIEFSCLSIPFIITTFINNSARYDFIMLGLIAIGILIAASNITLEKNLLNNKIVFFFEKLSLPIYIFHAFCLKIVFYFTSNSTSSYAIKLSLYLLFTIFFSMFILKLVELLKRKNYFIDKIKDLFIISS